MRPRKDRSRARAAWAGACLLLAPAAVGAQPKVVHEYVPNVQANEGDIALGKITGAGTIEYDGEVLTAPNNVDALWEAPPLSAALGDGREGEEPGRRSPSFRPDRQTALEGQLDYYEAFTPAIAPFKRMTSLDAITLDGDGKTPVLGISDLRKREVEVQSPAVDPADGMARDRFFGEVLLDFREGRELPLPSVAPSSRILHVKTTPAVTLHVERDGADNFYVRVVGKLPSQPVRMSFLTDAPRSYFGSELQARPARIFAREIKPLPPSVAARGRLFASELGIDESTDLRSVVTTLTRYFREWNESAVPPDDSGDIYLDLVRGKKGVCRHRAYGFVVTAQALGIPARFVQNEAHSWVEVKVSERGFMRIDLGGAAHGMTAHGASDRPTYVPGEPDALPQPESYRRSYSTLENGVTGLRPSLDAVTGRWVSPADGATAKAPPLFVAGSNLGQGPRLDDRKPITLTLEDRAATAMRGGKLSVTGRLTDATGAGVAGLRVEISLSSTTRKQRMLLGVTVSAEDGYFRASLGVPPDLSVGDYGLVVLTPGDANYLPVIAQ